MNVFKWIWSYVRCYKLKIFLFMIMVFIVSVLHTIIPRLHGAVVDRVIIGGEKDILFQILIVMAGVTLLRTVIQYCFQIGFHKISQDSNYVIRRDMYKHLQKHDFGFFDRTRAGEIMARMTGDLNAVRHFTAWTFYSILLNVVLFVFAMILLLSINVILTLSMIAITPFLAVTARKMKSEIKPAFANIREKFANMNSTVKENISGNRVVKAFAKEDFEIEKFEEDNQAFYDANLEATVIQAKHIPLMESMSSLMTVLLLLIGGAFVIKGSMTIGELVTFNGMAWAMNAPIRMSGTLINDIQNFSASADRIISLLETKSQIVNDIKTIEPVFAGRIEFKNVSFSYGEEDVVKDVSFTINAGETVAILGPTGAGKTSILNLICRYYDVDKGQVLIDGVDVRKIDLKTLRSKVSVAMQDVFLFSNTIEGNIAYSCPDIDTDEIIQYAKIADADEFLSKMSEGYVTVVGERGVGLSGGQKQRVSLARTLITDPAVLILDDTTSSVDLDTEKEIFTAMESISKDKTTIIVAHRISTIKNADRIYVLDDCKIIEQGTHNELLSSEGYYKRMYDNQIGIHEGSIA